MSCQALLIFSNCFINYGRVRKRGGDAHRNRSKGASMKRSRILAAAVAASTLVALAGCSSSGSGDGKTIKVAYQDFGSDLIDTFMKGVKKDYEAANKGEKVTLVPIKAAENDYYTKLSLMNRSASTAPDVLYEDTFLIRSDAQAGYLEPLD